MSTFDLQSRRGEVWNKLVREAEGLPTLPDALRILLDELVLIERFWAYPGPEVLAKLYEYLNTASYSLFKQLVSNVYCSLNDKGYRVRSYAPFVSNLSLLDKPLLHDQQLLVPGPSFDNVKKTYFEVLVIHPLIREYESMYRTALAELRSDRDEFVYDLVFVDSAQDAIAAVLCNPEIQSVVMVSGFVIAHPNTHSLATDYLTFLKNPQYHAQLEKNILLELSRYIKAIRPELDQFFISETPANQMEADFREAFSRILFHIRPFQDLHYHILNGVRERFSTPFFHALQAYSKKPRGMFHALPLSRAKSVQESPWTQDMLAFYGPNIFLAETSATQGGLDSLLDPKGTIKQAQDAAARAFGAEKTFFVTNGSSTANKIIMQATLCPSDIVLLSSDCHKSVPYAAILTGATPIFLETYFLPEYDLYGAVSLRRIKEVLLDLKSRGLLDRAKQITLTNSTFDGIVYNVAQLMTEILAIKPDIIFHWD
ncbi:MAG: ornithine decarboxylase, partial [Candidatus Margulisiibacteriota bacterium]